MRGLINVARPNTAPFAPWSLPFGRSDVDSRGRVKREGSRGPVGIHPGKGLPVIGLVSRDSHSARRANENWSLPVEAKVCNRGIRRQRALMIGLGVVTGGKE